MDGDTVEGRDGWVTNVLILSSSASSSLSYQ